MKYYMLEGTFSEQLPDQAELQKAIDAHLAYLTLGFRDGSVLLSGPKVGAYGGIIVVKNDDIERFCREDPLVKAGIQIYRVTEFSLYDAQAALKPWFREP
ncbi:MAG: YciI family protein [Eubacteriales bacterium]|nr:YciI family protein [Eubacteriales bacterium]